MTYEEWSKLPEISYPLKMNFKYNPIVWDSGHITYLATEYRSRPKITKTSW